MPQPSESLPQGNVFDDLPATPSVVIDEPIMAPPAPESPRARASAPRPEPARPPPPVPTVEVERPSALMVAYDRARWVLALGLLAAAIAVVSTWWIKNPPQRPRPPAAQGLPNLGHLFDLLGHPLLLPRSERRLHSRDFFPGSDLLLADVHDRLVGLSLLAKDR
jgi:hypothetical protein